MKKKKKKYRSNKLSLKLNCKRYIRFYQMLILISRERLYDTFPTSLQTIMGNIPTVLNTNLTILF